MGATRATRYLLCNSLSTQTQGLRNSYWAHLHYIPSLHHLPNMNEQMILTCVNIFLYFYNWSEHQRKTLLKSLIKVHWEKKAAGQFHVTLFMLFSKNIKKRHKAEMSSMWSPDLHCLGHGLPCHCEEACRAQECPAPPQEAFRYPRNKHTQLLPQKSTTSRVHLGYNQQSWVSSGHLTSVFWPMSHITIPRSLLGS